jgi:hypothetical protein
MPGKELSHEPDIHHCAVAARRCPRAQKVRRAAFKDCSAADRLGGKDSEGLRRMRIWLSGPRLFGKTSPRDRLAALWDVSVFGQRMRWMTRIAAPILLADVGDHRFGVFSLDLKSGDERVFGAHGDVVRLPLQFKPDGKLHERASYQYLGQTFIDV